MGSSVGAFRAAALAACLAIAGACATTGGTVKYRFVEPEPGPEAGRGRIRGIERTLRGAACEQNANARSCSQFAMEAGLIYSLVEQQELESENLLRRAYELDPSCDLRMLRAMTIAKRAAHRQELADAAILLAGEGAACDGTVARYYAAKLKILGTDAAQVASGRSELADLSTYSLGNSGIELADIYDLQIYSVVAAADFEAAEDELRSAFEAGVAVSPKLQALVRIGRGSDGGVAVKPEAQALAREFLRQQVQDYDFGLLVRELAQQANALESVRASPWDVVEESVAITDPGLTPAQMEIVRIGFEDEFSRLQDEIAALDAAKSSIEAFEPGLAAAEQDLVSAAIDAAFGQADPESLATVGGNYLRILRQIEDAIEKVESAVHDMSQLEHLPVFLVDAQAFARTEQASGRLVDAIESLAGDAADALLRRFAASVSRSLPAEEFFHPYEVDLGQLSFESEQVVENVARVVELSGGE